MGVLFFKYIYSDLIDFEQGEFDPSSTWGNYFSGVKAGVSSSDHKDSDFRKKMITDTMMALAKNPKKFSEIWAYFLNNQKITSVPM